MTASTVSESKTDPRVQVLRNMLRNLLAWRAAYETSGTDTITGPDGNTWVLWDLEELYRIAVHTSLLPTRARQAIELFLVQNQSEADVAKIMRIKSSNPTGMYATSGIVRLIEEMDKGNIPNIWTDNSKDADD